MNALCPPLVEPRVLVVDDEPRLRDLLVRAMNSWGFTVTSARSAEEALRQNSAEEPNIVVLDLNLPGMGGLDLLLKLRERLPNLQAIVLTGFASVESARQAVHLDVVEFLTKPCHLGELEQALDRALRRLTPTGQAVPETSPPSPAGATLHEVERQHILSTLARQGGNRTATAAELGISRRTLYYKLEEYLKLGYRIDDRCPT